MTERAERLVQRGCERLPPGGRGGERAVAARAPPPPSRSPPPARPPARLRLLLLCRRRHRRCRRRLQLGAAAPTQPGLAAPAKVLQAMYSRGEETSPQRPGPEAGGPAPLFTECLGRTSPAAADGLFGGAEGDACPVSCQEMLDISWLSAFVPGLLRVSFSS